MPAPSLVLDDLTFAFDPHDAPLLDGLNATFPTGRTGIVGRNGIGKSTLLRLVSGKLRPTRGSVTATGAVAHLRQDLLRRPGTRVAELLGIADTLAALARIEAGSVDAADFDAVGNDWDAAARATALLARRVPSLDPDGALTRRVGSLSGGELMLVALVGLELSRAPIAVLDEPTNNLDAAARARLYGAVEEWPRTLIVVSHDVELLRRMDAIAELRAGALRVYGGNYDRYTEQVAAEAEAAARGVRAAEGALRAEQRQRDHVQTAMARRARANAASHQRVTGGPRLSDPTGKAAAEGRRAAESKRAAEKVARARERLLSAEEAVRDDDSIRIDLVDPGTARGRRLAELVAGERVVHVTGGRRVALVGDNGVGKTTLLRSVLAGDGGRGRLFTSRYAYLDQRLALDDDASVLDVVRAAAPGVPPGEIRNRLARFLVRGAMVDQRVGTVSGGERFRVALAAALLADPPPELLILDEPTNNLDLPSVGQLVAALRSYRGALLVVSHDEHLLDALDLDETVRLTADGELVAE